MKKFRKLLAGLLAGAMMLGSMTATAFAEGESSTTVSTVDMTKKGSITVHKYFFENEKPNNLANGTGEAINDNEIPRGASALEGATFTIWKIADINGKITGSDSQFTVTGDMSTDAAAAEQLINSTDVANTKMEQVTDENGTAVFGKSAAQESTLDLGYYYVKETKTPANISSTPAAFVVSVPMTNQKENAGTKWIYDVVVYPKNVKTNAGVTIKKVGADGNDITANAQFILQKKNSGDQWKYVAGGSGSYNYEVERFDDATKFTQGTSITGLGKGSYRLFEVSVDFGYIMDGTIPYEFNIAGDGKISKANPGDKYLTFAQENGADNLKSAIITVKNERPDLEKTVKEGDTWKSESDKAFSANNNIEYRVKVTVPSNIAKLDTFKITDIPSNIIDDINSIKLYEDENLQTEVTDLEEDVDYTVTEAGDGFVLNFISADSGRVTKKFADKYVNGGTLYVHYQAKLKDGAPNTIVDENSNTAKLEYSNGIYPSSNESDMPNPGKEPDHAYTEDTAVFYTFRFTINKTDGNKALPGAHFALYKCENSGLTEESKIKRGTLIKKWETDDLSSFTADKLEAGYYYLIETKAPAGYNLLTKPVEIKGLNVQYKTTWKDKSEFVKDESGKWHLAKHERTKTEFTYEDGGVSHDFTGEQIVVNKKGFTLPTTGGMGTVIFSVLGIALVLAGLLVITASRKKAAK